MFYNQFKLFIKVDQRGFPIRESMIRVMTERIQDPELHDFIEESIIKCFHFLNSVNRMEKCEYSQNLLTCLIGKGKEVSQFIILLIAFTNNVLFSNNIVFSAM